MRVAVSSRVVVDLTRGARYDAVDQRVLRWLTAAMPCAPVAVPNVLAGSGGPEEWLHNVAPAGMVLTGGEDRGFAVDRDETEDGLLAYAHAHGLPVLGICRGLQMMATWSGGTLAPIDGHVGIEHRLEHDGAGGPFPTVVNSFHQQSLASVPPGFTISARAPDGAIEALRHEALPWEGWMWHPEREAEAAAAAVTRVRRLFGVCR